MSVRVMSAVWGLDLPDSDKIVLLALADCANDEGGCWPSMKTLAAKCSKTDRTIQASIKSLVANGHLTRDEVVGKGCFYTVHPVTGRAKNCDPHRRLRTPEAASPRRGFPPKRITPTPEAASDKPSGTINTPTVASQPTEARRPTKADKFPPPDGVADQAWRDFLASPKRRKAGMTDTAYSAIVRNLKLCAEHGFPPGEAVVTAVERGWTTVKLEWLENERDGRAGGGGNGRGARGGRPSGPIEARRRAREQCPVDDG